jgi:hypothetical protein
MVSAGVISIRQACLKEENVRLQKSKASSAENWRRGENRRKNCLLTCMRRSVNEHQWLMRQRWRSAARVISL